MKKFIIEREIPKIGTFDQNALQAASGQSCDALKRIGPQVIVYNREQNILRLSGRR